MKHSVKADSQSIKNWDDREMKVCGNKPRKRRISKAIRAKEQKEIKGELNGDN